MKGRHVISFHKGHATVTCSAFGLTKRFDPIKTPDVKCSCGGEISFGDYRKAELVPEEDDGMSQVAQAFKEARRL